ISREGGILAVAFSTAGGLPSAVDGRAPSLLASALTSGEPLTADGRIPWAPPGLRCHLPGGSVGAVPAGPLVLALVRAAHAPFVPLELARLGALLHVALATLGLHEAPTRQLREVAR